MFRQDEEGKPEVCCMELLIFLANVPNISIQAGGMRYPDIYIGGYFMRYCPMCGKKLKDAD